jgi:hypothetical protein
MAIVWRNQMPVFNLPQQAQFAPVPWSGFTASTQAAAFPTVPQDGSLTWSEIIVGGLALGLLVYAAYTTFSEPEKSARHCSVCDSTNHDRRNCPYDGPRIRFSRTIPMSASCECCGQYPAAQRHHTRGRSDDSDKLDVCHSCHLHCGHKGHWQNFPTKPRVCLFTDAPAFWRI